MYFRMFWEKSTAKNYHPIHRVFMISEVFEKLVNNRIDNHLEKCGLFSDFQYSLRSSQSTTDFQMVVTDRIAKLLTGLQLLKL